MKPLSKRKLKAMVHADRWKEIGARFGFTPQYHPGIGSAFIDWRSVPESVMDILKGNRSEPEQQSTRFILYELQCGVCHYCNMWVDQHQFSVDHMLPLYRGGTNSKQNKIGACKICNNLKSFMTAEEFISLDPKSPGIAQRSRKWIKAWTLEERRKNLRETPVSIANREFVSKTAKGEYRAATMK